MIRFVNAKLNLGLNIIRRRDDGYHDLETVFYPVGVLNGTPVCPEPFCDILEGICQPSSSDAKVVSVPCAEGGQPEVPCYHESEGIRYIMRGRKVDCPPEKNLLVRAGNAFAEAMREEGMDLRQGLTLILDKHLPDSAGLGGGSADASFALTLLNDLHGRPFTDERLERIALTLGADCPVFIRNRPAYAEGVGEKLRPVDLSLKGWWCVIAKPPVYVSTKEAFAGITPHRPAVPLTEIIRRPVEGWRGLMTNDFEDSLFPAHPELGALKDLLYETGAVYASMSGSGSSIFGLYRTRGEALRAIESLPPQTVGTPCLLD